MSNSLPYRTSTYPMPREDNGHLLLPEEEAANLRDYWISSDAGGRL
jgi:hypothetical protein